MRERTSTANVECVETVIVGAGVSGLCMAMGLARAGRTSFVVLEKGDDVGGTWAANRYPGCACDIPSHLYSFSFHRNPRWSSVYAPRDEIHGYLTHVAAAHSILPHVRLRTPVSSASWDPASARWLVRTSIPGGPAFSARFLVRATGAFHVPRVPALKGQDSFTGTTVHSSQWDPSLDVSGKSVAVVGTGASSVQIVPAVARSARLLYVFQRTPAWILPRPRGPISATWQSLFARVPGLMWLLSWLILLAHELLGFAFVSSGPVRRAVRRAGEARARRHLRDFIADPALRSALTPRFELGCKRVPLSNSFYRALSRPNVRLITGAINQLQPHRIQFEATDAHGRTTLESTEDLDVLVYATGFELAAHTLRIIGRDGLDLHEAGMAAFLGTTKHGFPNFFVLLGPNTGVGHNSQILMIEAQVNYSIKCILKLLSLSTSSPKPDTSIEVRKSTQDKFQELLHRRLPNTVWLRGGCSSWYLDPTNTNGSYVLWPGTTIEFMLRCALHPISSRYYQFSH